MLRHLWINRQRPRVLSGLWFKAWAKRVTTFPRLLNSTYRQAMLRLGGAKIGSAVFIAPCKYNGRKSSLKISDNTFIGRITLHLHDRIDIGHNVVINDGAVLFTASHDVESPTFRTTTAPIVIGDYAWIASNAILLPGARIGFGAVVGAGAVVRGVVPDYRIAVGNRATLLEQQRTRNLNYNPARLVAVFEAWLGSQGVDQSP
jgi:acetyltransferase-like isoleucine patch superfamily enzyme